MWTITKKPKLKNAGWKPGTKITLERAGDEQPEPGLEGCLVPVETAFLPLDGEIHHVRVPGLARGHALESDI